MELVVGLLNNLERKFISVREDSLDKYLNTITKIDEYEIIQTYYNNYKYRKLSSNEVIKYTRSRKYQKYTKVIEIKENTFNKIFKLENKYIKKIRKIYMDRYYKIVVDYFTKPVNITMVEVEANSNNLSKYVPPKHFLEVTNNTIYDNFNICNGSIIRNDIIIEGTDGVGKTETIKGLLKFGIIAQDRCTNIISKNMVDNISLETRAKIYNNYLKEINKIIIILINNNTQELLRRVNQRANISKFDRETNKYNKMYLDTYKYMYDNNMLENKMYLVDCTNLTIEEQVNKVKNIILRS